jgi:integrase
MYRMFDAAWREELVESNPVARVRLPDVRHLRKERMILRDNEFESFIAFRAVDLELRMASLVARCEGGMRTREVLTWDWSQIDRAHFAECIIMRAKGKAPQRLAVPPPVASTLRAWWQRASKPESGPVFPSRRGDNVGGFKSPRGYSFAERLRGALFVAEVWRMPPVEVAAASPGTRTDLGKRAAGMKVAPNPRDPLYFETATTLPVDFHSFRRAFNTALAEAGVNMQKAMALAAHGDERTHMRYVMGTTAMRTIPAEALPSLPDELPVESSHHSANGHRKAIVGHVHDAPTGLESSRAVTIAYMAEKNREQLRRATEDSNFRPTAPEAVALSS